MEHSLAFAYLHNYPVTTLLVRKGNSILIMGRCCVSFLVYGLLIVPLLEPLTKDGVHPFEGGHRRFEGLGIELLGSISKLPTSCSYSTPCIAEPLPNLGHTRQFQNQEGKGDRFTFSLNSIQFTLLRFCHCSLNCAIIFSILNCSCIRVHSKMRVPR